MSKNKESLKQQFARLLAERKNQSTASAAVPGTVVTHAKQNLLKQSKKTLITEVDSIKTMCQFLEIKLDAWDGFLFTDGSGGSVKQNIGVGYAAVLVDAEEVNRHLFNGGDNYGTVNSAELMAVVAALQYLVRKEAGVRQHGYRLHVMSDSQYVVNGLNKPNMLQWINNVNHNQLLCSPSTALYEMELLFGHIMCPATSCSSRRSVITSVGTPE